MSTLPLSTARTGGKTARDVAARTRRLVTKLNLHIAGVAVLALLNLYLLVHIALAWNTANSQDATAVASETARMQAAQQAAAPLRGLDNKLVAATSDADAFYRQRLPYADSQIVAELGALAKRQGVKLTRDSFAYDPALEGGVGALTTVRIDATLSGDYRPLMLFLNSLERDRLFFMISGVTLTGQQSGTVNLRIKLVSYLRANTGAEPVGYVEAAR